jgi:hypothetical protein
LTDDIVAVTVGYVDVAHGVGAETGRVGKSCERLHVREGAVIVDLDGSSDVTCDVEEILGVWFAQPQGGHGIWRHIAGGRGAASQQHQGCDNA